MMGWVRVKRLRPSATLPKYGTEFAAGMDLSADCVKRLVLLVGQQVTVPTGLAFEIPPGFFGKIEERSGLAAKHGIQVGAGVIDCDYRGEVHVLLRNMGNEPFMINQGDRIAQMIVQPYMTCTIMEANELRETERGGNGFGSTGINDAEGHVRAQRSLPLSG